jgi:amino acid transporter
MATSESSKPEAILPPAASVHDIDVEQLTGDKLRKNILTLPTIAILCIAAIAPAASMLFNVPVMASQAGASVTLVFVLSAIGVLLLGVSVLYFANRLSSAAGFSTWVRHGLGKGAAFQTGWLMIGGYALFEAALQSTVGGSIDPILSGIGFHIPGGWVTYSILLIVIVGVLSYFSITASIWVMAPFAVLEVLALIILDIVITVRGGVAGHDFVHTFLPLGSTVKGVAPGGILGIGIAMALGILAFVGFETAAVYGEEAKNPKRTIPVAVLTLIIGLAVLYIWTAYSATIGLGWQNAGTVLGNVANAPQQYITLANTFVGGWLGVALLVFVISSNFASGFAMHQAMVRYFYDMARAGLFPDAISRIHPRWNSPYIASIVQSVFSIVVIIFLGFVLQHTNKDGSSIYAFGFADGSYWQQTNGTVSFGWLASIVTMCIIVVYIMTNIAAPFFARSRGELRVLPHIVAPVLSILLLLLPLASYLGPTIPGPLGTFFVNLGFASTPFPSNILPLFVIIWVVIGLIYAAYLARRHPERYERMGSIVRND